MLALADSASGKRALCPNCAGEFRVPDRISSEDGPADWPAAVEPALPPGAGAGGSLIRCPACERTLAVDPSMVGQPIICPTCKRRMRVPAANEAPLPAANDYDPFTAPASAPNPYAALPTMPGSIPGMQTGTNYALPGAFLAIFGAMGMLLFGLTLLGAIAGLAAPKGPLEFGDFMFTFLWSLTSIVAQLLTFVGGVQMIRRRQLGWAKVGAFAALYPCGSCVLIQLPVAIWAIVILSREVAVYDFASPTDRLDLA